MTVTYFTVTETDPSPGGLQFASSESSGAGVLHCLGSLTSHRSLREGPEETFRSERVASSRGSRYQGDTRKLPDGLVGCSIEIKTRAGILIRTIVEVLEWTEDFVLVRDSGKPSSA